jgi:hypothetical protein
MVQTISIRERRLSGLNRTWRAWVTALSLVGSVVMAQEEKDPLDVKAAWLKNFAQFVDWPASRFANEKTPFVLGVIGDNPFGKRLEELASRNQVKKRRIELRAIKEIKDVDQCHMVFVCASEAERVAEVLKHAETNSVLTVSDMAGFVASGGMIQLCQKGKQIQFEVNQRKGMDARLVFDQRFCALAKPCESDSAP